MKMFDTTPKQHSVVPAAYEMGLGACFALLIALWTCNAPAQPKAYTADWTSLNSRPTPSWYTDAKFGIFIHWGVYSVPAWSTNNQYSEWYWHRIKDTNEKREKENIPWRQFHAKNYGEDFNYMDFAPDFRAELFDPVFWAKAFKDSGAKYVVLTSKHHDGFCLWPNDQASRVWGRPWNSVEVGPKRDVLGELADAVRAEGIKMGIYYSLYEWYNPLWLQDKKRFAVEHMHPQFKDVVTRYNPSIIFSDGEWDMPSADWKSPELLAWLFNEANCREDVVINDRWGKETRHKFGGYWTTEYGAGLPDSSHPWEENRGMAHSFGYSRAEQLSDYRTSKELVWMLADLVSRGGNLLLDIGPTADGRIPVIMQERLADMGGWLRVNGEAIYGTKTWMQPCQWTEGTLPQQSYNQYREKYDIMKLAGLKPVDGAARKQAFFTTKGNTVYAILPNWPGEQFGLRGLKAGKNTTIELLGVPGNLKFRKKKDEIVVTLPALQIDQMPCQYAWTLKISDVVRAP